MLADEIYVDRSGITKIKTDPHSQVNPSPGRRQGGGRGLKVQGGEGGGEGGEGNVEKEGWRENSTGQAKFLLKV